LPRSRNKKGLSEIIGYVLLIVFAVSMSAIVFSWLRAKVPKAEEKCPDDVSIEIISYNLNAAAKVLNFDLRNRGLFSVNGISIRLREGTKLCKITGASCDVCARYTTGSNKILFEEKIDPTIIKSINIIYEDCENPTDIEATPMRFIGENYVLCETSIYRDKVRSQ